MKPKDIIVGKRYKHRIHSDTIYLGCQNVKGKRKFLIILKIDSKEPNMTGYTVFYNGKEFYSVEFWNNFYKLK